MNINRPKLVISSESSIGPSQKAQAGSGEVHQKKAIEVEQKHTDIEPNSFDPNEPFKASVLYSHLEAHEFLE